MLCPDRVAPERHTCEIFGCAVAYASAGRPATPYAVVERRLRDLDARFSRFRADSELSRFNAQAGRWAEISPAMHAMLAHALEVAVASRGLVNAAILPRLVAAGYAERWPAPRLRAPLRAARPAAQPVPPLTQLLELQRGRARLQPGAAVDVGGLAKGLWADDVVRWLGGDAVCSLGGDVSAAGPGPAGDGWPVGLPGGRVLVVRDAGVATSGVGKRWWGPGAHHLIDPRTGLPAATDLAMVTVVSPTARAAEWLATAMIVGGRSEAERLAARADVLACFTEGTHP